MGQRFVVALQIEERLSNLCLGESIVGTHGHSIEVFIERAWIVSERDQCPTEIYLSRKRAGICLERSLKQIGGGVEPAIPIVVSPEIVQGLFEIRRDLNRLL